MSQYTDIINKRSRTWPFGTEKIVKVVHVGNGFIICVDNEKEGYVLLHTDGDNAIENDEGIMVFTKGGPLGGYWKFHVSPHPSPRPSPR